VSWKKIAVASAALMLAGYFGVRMALPERGGLALAASAVAGGRDGLVVVSPGAPGSESNRLVMIDTNKKLILLYRLRTNSMYLAAARTYDFDLKLPATNVTSGGGLSYEQVKELVIKSKALTLEQKRASPRGREMVLTTDGSRDQGNRVVLVNPIEKRILVYRLDGNAIWLASARPYDYDERLVYTPPHMAERNGRYDVIRKQVEAAMKKHAARLNAARR